MKNSILKRLFWFVAVVMTAGLMLVSCEGQGPEEPDTKPETENPEQPENPGDTPTPPTGDDETKLSEPVIIEIEGENPVPHPQIPMKIYDTSCKVSDAGVSVEVFDITEDNFSITLRPGKDVASYKLDVYPLCILYNFIIDECGLGKSEAEVEETILAHLFNAEGSGGYAFTPEDLGDDYAEFTIDWGNSTYAQLHPVPDAQYIVAVGACYDDSASEAAMTELTLVYVHTKSKQIVGNPDVEIEVNAQYKGAIVTNVPNSDCAGVYYFATQMDMIDPYVDAFGDRMLRDFIRHYYVPNTPVAADAIDNLTYQIGPWEEPDPTLMITAVAVGVDANGTPSKNLKRVDFHLKPIPEDTETAMMEYSLDEENYSATYAELVVELDKECRSGFHLLLKMDEQNFDGYLSSGRTYLEGGDDVRAALKNHIALYGYGVANKNFSYDFDKNEATGQAFTDKWVEYNLAPDTEYVIAYCGKNAYGDVSDICFSEVFKTKPLVTDRPADNKSNCELTYTDVSTTAFTVNFDYDPANTAVINFICTYYGGEKEYYDFSGNKIDVPAETASREEWIAFFEATGPSSFMTIWPRSMSGHDQYTLAGIDPGIKVTYAYYAEDMNGVMSEIKFASVTTKELQPGPDPQVAIAPVWDEASKTWTVEFKMVQDCAKMKYCLMDDGSSNMYLSKLGTSEMKAYQFYDHWDNFVGTLGLETNYESTTQTSVAGKDSVALAVGFGKDENGDEEISKLQYVILTKDGQQKKISDYYPNYVEKLIHYNLYY